MGLGLSVGWNQPPKKLYGGRHDVSAGVVHPKKPLQVVVEVRVIMWFVSNVKLVHLRK